MADEARLNELLDLVEQARSEGDKDTESKAIAAYRRESSPQPVENPAQYGGTGGYNPMQSMIGGSVMRAGEGLGMTPENTAKPLLNAIGPLETVLQGGTGLGATILGGLSGIGQGAWNAIVPKRFEGQPAADSVREVQEKLTYQPRTGAGAGMSAVVAAPNEVYAKGTDYLGGKATDITGSPLIGAAIKTGGDAVPMVFGAKSVPRSAGPRMTGTYKPVKFDIPTTEALRGSAKQAYAASKEAGIVVRSQDFDAALPGLREAIKDEAINAKLHPKSSAVMEEIEKSAGRDLTLQEAENLRKLALDAEADVNNVGQPTPDARIAGKIVDELDDRIDALSANNEARARWSRMKRSQTLDTMIARAEIKAGAHYTQAGMEHALRQEFKTLALNPRRMRGLNAEQKAAIEKVAKGGPIENTLRTFGKFDPTSGPVAAMASFATGGLMPLIGFGARRAATSATVKNVDAAREALVGRGMPNASLPTKGSPTIPLEVAQALVSKPAVRSSATIRSEIQSLVQKAGSQPGGPASASARATWLELERLQAELASAELREATQGGPGAPQSR